MREFSNENALETLASFGTEDESDREAAASFLEVSINGEGDLETVKKIALRLLGMIGY